MRNNKGFHTGGWAVSILLSGVYSGMLSASELPENKVDEETIVMGSRSLQGDYTVITEDAEKLVEMAGALGDPLGAVYALPGVVYSGDNGGEPAVRGSSPSDNVYVVDFMPASYIFHDFGVSIFNENTLQDFNMYSAGFGPEYTGATGAVFDVRLRDPENKKMGGVVDFSMLRSGVFIESAITDSTAFYASYRQSLIDKFISSEDASDDDLIIKQIPKDTDYQFKTVWNISEWNKLSLSINGATDEAAAEFTETSEFVRSNPDFEGDAKIKTAYNGSNLVWELNDGDKNALTVGVGVLNNEENLYWGNGYISELEYTQETAKVHYQRELNSQFDLVVGAEKSRKEVNYNIDFILFVCTEFDPSCETSRRERIVAKDTFTLTETSSFADLQWIPLERLALNFGAQFQENDYTGERYTLPRGVINIRVSETTKLKVKAGKYSRFPDLEKALEQTGNPNIKSPLANHYTLGIEQGFGDDWSLSVETYYKELSQLPRALAEGSDTDNERYASDTEGEAYGVDIILNKNWSHNWYGWLALSYGKSNRTNALTQEKKDYHLDTPLIFNWVMNWQAMPRFNIGWRWSIRSGAADTPIVGVRDNPYFDDAVLPIYGDSYSDRLPLYNRLDIRMKWDLMTMGYDSAIILDIINATNYKNIEERSLNYDKGLRPGDKPITVDSVGLGITPALTYQVSF